MTRDELYAHLPQLIRRLFTYGLGSAVLFFVFWYMGGHNLWGHFLGVCLKLTAFFYDLRFQPGTAESASILHHMVIEGGPPAGIDLEFKINLLSAHMVEVITLLAMWPSANKKEFFRLAFWCLACTVLYQTFNVLVQLHVQEIGPKLATRFEVMWEWDGSWWYALVKKVSNFDKFILRYWAGFPIFLCALVLNYFTTKKSANPMPGKKKN